MTRLTDAVLVRELLRRATSVETQQDTAIALCSAAAALVVDALKERPYRPWRRLAPLVRALAEAEPKVARERVQGDA